MVAHPRATLRADQLRALNQPRPIVVEAKGARPRTVMAGNGRGRGRDRGRGQARRRVTQVRDVWRIDDEWWRSPISRHYYQLVLDDGSLSTVYHDLVAGDWFEQRC